MIKTALNHVKIDPELWADTPKKCLISSTKAVNTPFPQAPPPPYKYLKPDTETHRNNPP